VDSPQRESNVGTQIEVVEACGEWFVRVTDEGREITRQFDLESFALVYAEGQRLRLKLAGITRF
jgi:hypothetical protein